MNGSEKESIICVSICALVVIAFIGGCTVAERGRQNTNALKACIEQQMEWRDGSCVKAGVP